MRAAGSSETPLLSGMARRSPWHPSSRLTQRHRQQEVRELGTPPTSARLPRHASAQRNLRDAASASPVLSRWAVARPQCGQARTPSPQTPHTRLTRKRRAVASTNEQGLAPPERLHPGLDRPPRRGTFEPLVASPLGSVADPLGDLGCLSGDSLEMISGPRTGGTVAEQLRRLMEPGSGSQSTRSPPTNRKP